MSNTLQQILDANQAYANSFGDKGSLAIPPARRFAVLTCMDARLDPAKFAGLAEGDAHIIRNAGGRASDDAIRSLVISYKLLGTKEWFVIHHTGCGMVTFTSEKMGEMLEQSLEPAELTPDGWKDVGKGPGTTEGKSRAWLTFTDETKSVVDDVIRIKQNPMVPNTIPIYGYVYRCDSGKLVEVPEATKAGAAS